MFNLKLSTIFLCVVVVSFTGVFCISGGKYAKEGQFNYIASLSIRNYGSYGYDISCTGSLISNTFVMTAAHCIKTAIAAIVKLGSVNRDRPYKVLNVKRRSRFFVPRNFANSDDNDIGLIRIPYVDFDDNLYPVNLPPTQDNSFPQQYFDRFAVLSGFGLIQTDSDAYAPILKYVPVRIDNDCWTHNPLKTGFCARSSQQISTALGGDSGGPLVLNECRIQIGILYASYNKDGSPMFFTQISKQLPWIKSIVKNLPVNNYGNINLKCVDIFNQYIKPFGGNSLVDINYKYDNDIAEYDEYPYDVIISYENYNDDDDDNDIINYIMKYLFGS